MTIPDAAVQAALKAHDQYEGWDRDKASRQSRMQAALAAAFPVMLREVAEKMATLSPQWTMLQGLADHYSYGQAR